MINAYRFKPGYSLLLALSVWLSLAACRSAPKVEEDSDSSIKGSINVSADESFKPIIDEMKKIYESNRPGTTINVTYKPEADCLRDMFVDSVRMIIATRFFSPNERAAVADTFKVGIKGMVIARDGVSVIVHPTSADTLLTMADVKAILTGSYKKKLIPVFDGLKATSTVRFIIDSVLKGAPLTPDAVAARSSRDVLDYVARTPGAIGFVGVSWIGNPEDLSQLDYLKKIAVAQVESTDIPGGFVKATQGNIYIRRYPMVRDLVYIVKEKHEGLGTAFANFMSSERGQLVFKRAYLSPIHSGLGIRPVRLNE